MTHEKYQQPLDAFQNKVVDIVTKWKIEVGRVAPSLLVLSLDRKQLGEDNFAINQFFIESNVKVGGLKYNTTVVDHIIPTMIKFLTEEEKQEIICFAYTTEGRFTLDKPENGLSDGIIIVFQSKTETEIKVLEYSETGNMAVSAAGEVIPEYKVRVVNDTGGFYDDSGRPGGLFGKNILSSL